MQSFLLILFLYWPSDILIPTMQSPYELPFSVHLIPIFMAVVESKSITGASQRLRISQPSITGSIQRLERELGTTLFYRGSSGVTPTPDGLRFMDYAEKLSRKFRQRPLNFVPMRQTDIWSLPQALQYPILYCRRSLANFCSATRTFP